MINLKDALNVEDIDFLFRKLNNIKAVYTFWTFKCSDID